MEIRPITREEFGGREYRYRYTTNGYYDIVRTESGFSVEFKPLNREELIDDVSDTMLDDWLDDPQAYGAFDGGELIAFAEGYLEKWNNRYWIANIHVFDDAYRGLGIGSQLMAKMLGEAERAGARMAVLETQNSNVKAIAFYKKQGFELIGFDLYAYSDTDPEKHNIRLLMGKKLHN